MLKVDR